MLRVVQPRRSCTASATWSAPVWWRPPGRQWCGPPAGCGGCCGPTSPAGWPRAARTAGRRPAASPARPCPGPAAPGWGGLAAPARGPGALHRSRTVALASPAGAPTSCSAGGAGTSTCRSMRSQQWAAELALVARHLVGRAAAGPLARARGTPAGARIHGGNQLEPGREIPPALRRAGDGDVAGFERLAQGLQRSTGNSAVRPKQHALVGERDFAGAGVASLRPPAPRRWLWWGWRVGRRPQSSGRKLPARLATAALSSASSTCMAGSSPAKALRQHGLARPGGPPSRGHGRQQRQSPARRRAAVWPFTSARSARRWGARWLCLQHRPAFAGAGGSAPGGRKALHHIQQVARTHHRAPGTRAASSALPGAAPGRRCCLRVQRQAGGQRAAHGAQLAGQGQLARKFMPRQPAGIDLPTGGGDAQRNRQVEPPGILGQIGRAPGSR